MLDETYLISMALIVIMLIRIELMKSCMRCRAQVIYGHISGSPSCYTINLRANEAHKWSPTRISVLLYYLIESKLGSQMVTYQDPRPVSILL